MKTSTRELPRVAELMPFTLELLCTTEEALRKKNITEQVDEFVKSQGMKSKPLATGYTLTYLKKAGYVQNVRRGYWMATDDGRRAKKDPATMKQLEQIIESEYFSGKTKRNQKKDETSWVN